VKLIPDTGVCLVINVQSKISVLINKDAAIFKIDNQIIIQIKKLIVIEIVKIKKAWYLFITPFLRYAIFI